MQHTEPTAAIRQHDSRIERLTALWRSLNVKADDVIKTSETFDAELLVFRESCAVGEWTAFIKASGMSRTAADRALKRASNKRLGTGSMRHLTHTGETWEEKIKASIETEEEPQVTEDEEDAPEDQEETPQCTEEQQEQSNTPSEPTSPPEPSRNGQAEHPPAAPEILCASCHRKRRVGQELPNKCPECKELRAAADSEDEEPAGEPEAPPEPPAPKKLQDDIYQEVPEHLVAVFEEADTFKAVISTLNGVGRDLDQLAQHPAGALLRLQQAKIELKELKRTVRFDKPYCVCPVCKANETKRKANCPCKGRGWLNEASYGNLPTEYRS